MINACDFYSFFFKITMTTTKSKRIVLHDIKSIPTIQDLANNIDCIEPKPFYGENQDSVQITVNNPDGTPTGLKFRSYCQSGPNILDTMVLCEEYLSAQELDTLKIILENIVYKFQSRSSDVVMNQIDLLPIEIRNKREQSNTNTLHSSGNELYEKL